MARYVPDPARRIAVFLGEAAAVNPSCPSTGRFRRQRREKRCRFFDLDQTKPLMRSRDVESLLESAGVSVRFEHQTADAPHAGGRPVPRCWTKKRTVILDVGGNDTGARLIGGCAHLLKSADAYFVVNPYRPWSGTVEHIDGTLSAVLRAARLGLPRFPAESLVGRADHGGGIPHRSGDGAAAAVPLCDRGGGGGDGVPAAAGGGHTELPLIPITAYVRPGCGT